MRAHKSVTHAKSVRTAHKGKHVAGRTPPTNSSRVVRSGPAVPSFTQAHLFNIEVGVFKRLCKAVNTPFAQEQLSRVESGDWLGIANAPFPDTASPSFPDDYLLQQVMRKNPRLPIRIDRRKAATEAFFQSERVCRQSNDLMRSTFGDPIPGVGRTSLAIHPRVLARIRNIIRDILGPLTDDDLEYVKEHGRFGPGATFHCSSKDLTTAKKYESVIGFTPSLSRYVAHLTPRGWKESSKGFRITAGSRSATVPKDALTDRFIAIEPSLNMWWQLGVGALIRRKLKRSGLDLRHQADKNRLRVRFAQVSQLATIDLKAASDTVAKGLVRVLLPQRWSHLLSMFRSPAMQVDGVWHQLEKFSSMGNGYTFELETLIFYAVAKAFDEDPYVFGDDIIVRQDVGTQVVRTLNVLGFEVNRKKTFMAGVFFESCGSDFWQGKNVRPFFFKKEEHESLTSAVIRMANAVRRYAHRRNLGLGCDSRFLPAWLYLLSRCPDARTTGIPEGYGDVGIVREFDDAAPTKLRYGHCGYLARAYSSTPASEDVTFRVGGYVSSLFGGATEQIDRIQVDPITRITWDGRVVPRQFGISATVLRKEFKPPLAECWMYSGGAAASKTSQSMRGRNNKPKLRDLTVQDWKGLGPWI